MEEKLKIMIPQIRVVYSKDYHVDLQFILCIRIYMVKTQSKILVEKIIKSG